MNTADIILIILIAAAVVFGIRLAIRRRKNGSSCCGTGSDCSACPICTANKRSKKQ